MLLLDITSALLTLIVVPRCARAWWQASQASLSDFLDENGCVQLAACYTEAHSKVLECQMQLDDLEAKEKEEEKTCSKVAKNLERRRDIKSQLLRIEHMQQCYKNADLASVELNAKIARKCARKFASMAQEAQERLAAQQAGLKTGDDKAGKKKSALHRTAVDDYERWATKVDQCMRSVGQLRNYCKPLVPCCPFVRECKAQYEKSPPELVQELTSAASKQRQLCKKQKSGKGGK